MQEKIFIIESFLDLLSGDTAINKIKAQAPASTIEELQYIIDMGREIDKYCREIETFNFIESPDLRDKLLLSTKEYILDVQDIYFIHKSLTQWKQITQYEIVEKDFPKLYYLIHSKEYNRELFGIWEHAFDDEGKISDNASPELKRIRSMKKNLRHQIEKLLQSNIQKNEDLAEKRIAFREDRYVLPIRTNAKNRNKGIVHGFSNSGTIAYIEPIEVIELNNELLTVDDLEQKEIYRLLRQWSTIIAEYHEQIGSIIEQSSELEIYTAKSVFAKKYNAQFGTINNNNEILLTNVFNPFLLIKKGRSSTIPITITLKQPHKGIVISGPNAGGKSAALKTLGICAELFMLGIPIPAEEIEFPFFSSILMEIGDAQNLEDELSTFSGHITHINNILDKCGSSVLVLIDEIAHATNPIEGEALGCAVIDELIAKQTFFAITTHYPKIKIKAFENNYIQIYSVGFDLERLMPQFKLYPNTIGESYALKIAAKSGLCPNIINNAERFITENQNKTEQILANIEAFEAKLFEKEKLIQEKQHQLEQFRIQAIQKQEQLNTYEKQLKTKGLEQADIELYHCLRELSSIQKILEKQPKESGTALKKIQKTLNEKKSEAVSFSRPKAENIKIGDEVFSASLNRKVIIEEINKNNIIVRSGILKFPLNKNDIFETQKQPISNTIIVKHFPTNTKNSIDVHGMRTDEALKTVEQALYSAINAGLTKFSIIHGKGTGILQKFIHEFLQTVPEVQSFHLALPQEGGGGKTIVYL
ncbi:MAG: endonuclease MutS2 [Brevinemataceae bacterium]